MSDPQKVAGKTEPDEDLLEFLGGIDEVNDDSQDEDFSDYLARTDIDSLAASARKPKAPAEGEEK
jgi:hypothetical protein